MLRSLTFAFATVFAVATLAAQAPAQDQPAGDRPAVQQAPPEPAQQPSQPPAREPAASPKSTSDSSKVTMTGCLKPGATAGSWTLETSPAAARAASPSTPVGTPAAGVRPGSFGPRSGGLRGGVGGRGAAPRTLGGSGVAARLSRSRRPAPGRTGVRTPMRGLSWTRWTWKRTRCALDDPAPARLHAGAL